MVLLMPEERVGKVSGLTQMGGEGAQWIGMAPFTERGHFVQNVGDGTFFHSGSLGVRAAVAAGVNITFKILFNSAVAMTGGQEAVGGGGVAELTRLLAAEGVARTIVTSDDVGRLRRAELAPNARLEPRSRMLEAQEELAATPGVTVLIHEQECAAELRRKRKRGKATDPAQRVLINERVCEGCGDCGRKSNCLSVQPVETEFGPKTRIHQASCNKDFSCLEGDCPSFLTITGVTAVRKPGEVVAELPPDTIPEPASSVEAPASVRIVGVGGTGVVTVAQVLGTAALIDGFTVRGLDQTGLAQKGGTVVSDLRIFSGPAAEGNKISDGGADLYLGCDLLASVAPQNLRAASPQRTRAVVSTTDVPTGAMVSGAAQPFPDEGRGRDAIDSATRTGNRYLDSQALARRLFGGDQTANVLLLGVAYQDGSIPVSAAAIEQAIELNGASVQQNIQAFRRGRQWAHDPNALEAVAAGRGPDGEQRLSPADQELAASVGATPGGELERVLQIRVPDLVAYQSRAYARRYCELVGRTRVAEHDAVDSEELTAAVAIGLHKLMTYKDEYEVARLHLDAGFRAQVERDFGPGARVQWNLHPPVLRSLGMRGKWRVGRWFAGVFHLLRAMRKLRFTPIDPFGWAHVRRVERDLIDEYRRVVEMLLEVLAPDTHGRCVEIAALPDMVRGYESIKLENVARYHARLGELCHVLAEESGSDAPKEVIDRG